MARYVERFSGTATNAAINAGAFEIFAVDASDIANKRQYGSMNQLLVSYTGARVIELELDGQVVARFSNSTFALKPEDGRFFEIVKITNKDGAVAVTAGDIRIRWARADYVGA